MTGTCAAWYFSPKFIGKSMGKKEPSAKSAVVIEAIQRCRCDFRQCTNRSGHGTRCKREALPDRKRCKKCTRMNLESLRRNWPTRMVLYSHRCDLKRSFKWAPSDYISKEWLTSMFARTGATCYWCGATNLNLVRRSGPDGFTVERLCNALPHLKRNCTFACATCNRKSWHSNFKTMPHHLSKYRFSRDPRLTRDTILCQDRLCLEIRSRDCEVQPEEVS